MPVLVPLTLGSAGAFRARPTDADAYEGHAGWDPPLWQRCTVSTLMVELMSAVADCAKFATPAFPKRSLVLAQNAG